MAIKVKAIERNVAFVKGAINAFYTTLIVSIMLIVGGFFVPPLGIIDGSVLTAVGLMLMFAVLAQVPGILQAVRDGERIKLSKGDFSAEVSRENKEQFQRE